MSKIKDYIEDAVKETASQIKTKGVEISHVNVDNATHVHVDNGDMTAVLLELAKAQSVIAEVALGLSKSKPKIENNSTGLSLTGLSDKPMEFTEDE